MSMPRLDQIPPPWELMLALLRMGIDRSHEPAEKTDNTYDGKPCSRGHGTRRYRSNNGCVTCISETSRSIQAVARRMS